MRIAGDCRVVAYLGAVHLRVPLTGNAALYGCHEFAGPHRLHEQEMTRHRARRDLEQVAAVYDRFDPEIGGCICDYRPFSIWKPPIGYNQVILHSFEARRSGGYGAHRINHKPAAAQGEGAQVSKVYIIIEQENARF